MKKIFPLPFSQLIIWLPKVINSTGHARHLYFLSNGSFVTFMVTGAAWLLLLPCNNSFFFFWRAGMNDFYFCVFFSPSLFFWWGNILSHTCPRLAAWLADRQIMMPTKPMTGISYFSKNTSSRSTSARYHMCASQILLLPAIQKSLSG